MKDKKSFIAYCDWIEVFEELTDEQAGKLIKHLLSYVNDKDPKTEDQIVKIAFISLKQTLKRDLQKYDKYIQKQTVNGSKGGRPPKPKEPKPFYGNPKEPKKADSVSVNDSVTVSDSDIVKELTNNFSMIEEVGRALKTSPDNVQELLNDFIQEQKAKGELGREISELRRHFVSWSKIEHKKQNKNGESRRDKFAENDRKLGGRS